MVTSAVDAAGKVTAPAAPERSAGPERVLAAAALAGVVVIAAWYVAFVLPSIWWPFMIVLATGSVLLGYAVRRDAPRRPLALGVAGVLLLWQAVPGLEAHVSLARLMPPVVLAAAALLASAGAAVALVRPRGYGSKP